MPRSSQQRSWRRRLAPPILGAGVAAAAAAIVGALTHPYAEKVNDSYREGAQTGLVIRYTVLGGLAAWLVDLIVQRVRQRGSLRGTLSERSVRAQLQVVGLVVVVFVAVVPIFLGGYDPTRAEHAGFMAGCARDPSLRSACECLWTKLNEDPATGSTAEREAMTEQMKAAALRRAAAKCGG